MAQRINGIDNVKLDENNERFESGEIRIGFTVSHSADIKTGKDEPDAVGENVPHTAVIDVTGAKVEDVLQQASKPRIISLQNSLKNSAKTADQFDKMVRNKESHINLVPEGRKRKDPKKDIMGFVAGLEPDQKVSFMDALENDTVDEWLAEYYA